MLHENDYRVIITHEGVLVFLIKCRDDQPENPFLLYDGGNHATFYRRENQTVLFDYLNEKVIPLLQNSEKIVIFELNDEIEDVARDYEAYVRHVKKNVFTDNLP